MANLTDKPINSTYQSLLKTINNTEINGPTEISDGLGNPTGIVIGNDGRLETSGTITFGTLKDGGENINIDKFIDEADGIANNDNDTSIPTSAAIVDYVASVVTLEDLDLSADTGNGSVDLNSEVLTISGGDNVTTSISGQEFVISSDDTNLSTTHNSGSVDIESSTGTSTTINPANITTAGVMTSADKSKLDSISPGAGINPSSTDDLTEGSTNLYYTDDRVSANADVSANTAKVGITSDQASAIEANTNKVGITISQADAIIANTAKNSYPSADATKVGHISVTQAVDLDTLESDVATNNAKVGITTQQANEIAANTLKTGITAEQADAITANTAKVGITTQQASDITANNAKVGITSQQASDITTNNAKVGITTQQASDITANNAKISFDSASSTKLAGIAENATNVTNNNQITNGAGYTTNTGTVTSVTVGTGLDVTNGTTTPALSLDLSEFSDMTADMIGTDEFIVLDNGAERRKAANEISTTILDTESQTNAIGNAIDFSARVTLAGGVAEGTSGIIKNLQSIS